MTAPLLADALGPRGRRLTLVVTAVSAAVLLFVTVVALRALAAKGQFEPALWRPFTQLAIWRFLGVGLLNTLRAALGAMAIALPVGGLLALGQLTRLAPVRWLCRVWVEFFRGVPLLLLILFCSLGLPHYGINLPTFWNVVLALVLYNGAVLGEIFRAGILSLEQGQMQAGLAIGLTYWQAMRLVVIPQAVRRMIPAIISQLVTLLKDTSLGYIIAYEELLRRGGILGQFAKNILQSLFVAAAIYVVVNFTLSRIAGRLEVRQRRRYAAGAIHAGGVEDLAILQANATAITTDD